MKLVEKKYDHCGKKVQGKPVNMYFIPFVALNTWPATGANVDGTSDGVY